MTGDRIAVLGGGPGGYVAAIRAAALGKQVTLIESGDIGGTCLNRGCIPSKIMKHTADLFLDIKKAGDFGITLSGAAAVDMAGLMARKQRIIQNQARGIQALLKKRNVEYVQGRGTISSMGDLTVVQRDNSTRNIAWDALILATGAAPRQIDGIPFDGRRIFSSDSIFDISRVPGHITILGGGVIGCEFAFIFSALGSNVTVVEADSRLMPQPFVDEECTSILLREMKKNKIKVHLKTSIAACRKTGERLTLRLEPSPFGDADRKGSLVEISSDALLVCIGREPNSREIGLETIGVATDEKGWVRAGETMRTNLPGVFAIGDVLGPDKIMLAHAASFEGMVAAENAAGHHRRMRYGAIPNAVYTRPEIAGVGHTIQSAETAYKRVQSDTVLFRHIGKAHVIGEIAGQVKIVSDAETGTILGVHIIGPHATDLIAEGALAIEKQTTVHELARTIHAHPTLSEALMEAAFTASGTPIHG